MKEQGLLKRFEVKAMLLNDLCNSNMTRARTRFCMQVVIGGMREDIWIGDVR